MSVYLSVAPPDGFSRWSDADWDRWLREHPWEAAERVWLQVESGSHQQRERGAASGSLHRLVRLWRDHKPVHKRQKNPCNTPEAAKRTRRPW